MIFEAIMKEDYLIFANNSRIFIAVIYLMTAIGLIYFGLNLIYEVKTIRKFLKLY